MDSTPIQAESTATTAEQPRLQRNTLNLFETIAGTLANLAPAEGIFLSLGHLYPPGSSPGSANARCSGGRRVTSYLAKKIA